MRVEGEAGIYARADAKRVRQVLTNLVGNAIKFTQQGEVVVDVGRDGRFARLSVRDTGPGISPQERAVIFEEYKQTKEERARRRGTGLGPRDHAAPRPDAQGAHPRRQRARTGSNVRGPLAHLGRPGRLAASGDERGHA